MPSEEARTRRAPQPAHQLTHRAVQAPTNTQINSVAPSLLAGLDQDSQRLPGKAAHALCMRHPHDPTHATHQLPVSKCICH